MLTTQEPKYDCAGQLVNRATGDAIPDDEPVFILRAKDRRAVHALYAYALVVSNPEHAAVVRKRIDDFTDFATQHPQRMKEPDSPPHLITAATVQA